MVTGMLCIINKVQVFVKFICYAFSESLFCRDVSVGLYSIGQNDLKVVSESNCKVTVGV